MLEVPPVQLAPHSSRIPARNCGDRRRGAYSLFRIQDSVLSRKAPGPPDPCWTPFSLCTNSLLSNEVPAVQIDKVTAQPHQVSTLMHPPNSFCSDVIDTLQHKTGFYAGHIEGIKPMGNIPCGWPAATIASHKGSACSFSQKIS